MEIVRKGLWVCENALGSSRDEAFRLRTGWPVGGKS